MSGYRMLSECGTKLVVDDKPGDRYEVEIESGDYIVVEAGACAGKAAARFSHPNVAATVRRVYEFKHYRSGGSKFWTSRAGVSHYFVVPKTAVRMLLEKGHSYVPAEINGVKVGFNVSGGGGLWTDYVGRKVSVSVNHPVRDLRRIAEVSVRGTALEPLDVKVLDAEQDKTWNRLVARTNASLKEKVAEMVEAGKSTVVKLLPGYDCDEGMALEVMRRLQKVKTGEMSWKYEETGAVKGFVLACDGRWHKIRAKATQVDWHATAVANGMEA